VPDWLPLVEATRDGLVESCHVGVLAVADTRGELAWSIGDPGLRTFPRSALKPFQLLTLVARGGVERFGFTSAELAIMAASHSGEPVHIQAVESVLHKIGAGPDQLACGVHAPLAAEAAAALSQAGQTPSAIHNNCSGKHAGMLALARLLDAPLDGYIEPDHPTQCAIRACLVAVLGLPLPPGKRHAATGLPLPLGEGQGEATGLPLPLGQGQGEGATDLHVGIDGCSAPAYAVPLRSMARGFALLAAPDRAPERWRSALATVAGAMRAYPELVGGTSGRTDTDLMRANPALVAKGGAEGYFCVGHPDGLGLALKVLDGDPGGRARPIAAVAAARRLGWTDLPAAKPITNWAGLCTGELRPAPALGDV
jgi:L-asparaginase II